VLRSLKQTAAASRQTFAFARDGALPLSNIISYINSRTGTPVNAVWVVTFVGWLFGFLAFAGPTAIGAVFALPIAAQYVAYIVPITCRFVFKNDFTPGPFYLGRFVRVEAIRHIPT
jgi:amino acid transporter